MLLVYHFEAVVELRKLIDCAQDRVGNQVGVRGLAEPWLKIGLLTQMPVNEAAVFVEQLNRNATLRSRGRNRKAGFHVLHDLQCGAANRDPLPSGFSSRWCGRRLGRCGFCRRDAGSVSMTVSLGHGPAPV